MAKKPCKICKGRFQTSMLIRDNFRQQFYEIIGKQHVLVLVGGDVDGLCASVILMQLFTCDDIAFSVVPVGGWQQLQAVMREHYSQTRYIVLINCGGTRSLKEFEPPPGCVIFVLDSRRPLHLDNIYDAQNIRVLVHSDEWDATAIPQVSEIYRDDSSESEDDLDELDAMSRRERMERVEKRAVKRAVRSKWEAHRRDKLWEYYENSWFALSSSVCMLELAAALGRGSPENLFLAAIGLNSQYVDRLITLDAYTAVCVDRLRPFIQRYASKTTERAADDLMRVIFEKELPIALYEHWSLMKAMSLDEKLACQTQFWTQRGEEKLKELLAQLGLTLSECRQKWSAMSSERRKEVFTIIDKAMASSFASFHAFVGYSGRLGARDTALSLAVHLESPAKEKVYDRFSETCSALLNFLNARGSTTAILRCAEKYKMCLDAMSQVVAQALNQSELLPTGPFYLFVSPKSVPDEITDSRHLLFNFMHFLLRAFASARPKATNRSIRPLVAGFPLAGERTGWFLVSGIMPLNTVYHDTHQKSFIGRAFRRVTELSSQLRIQQDFFDSSTEDRGRFFDALQAVLETTS